MQTKLSKVKAAYDKGDYKKAISLAAKFSDLGAERDDILRAQGCYTNPGFYRQLGMDIDECIYRGCFALSKRYGWGLPANKPYKPPFGYGSVY